VEVMSQMLAPSRVWSASQLNDYGLCGFRFFGKRILRLESLDEPEDGLDVAQRGQLIHTILERTYRELQLQSVSVTHENLEAALGLLYHHMDAVFAQPPDDIQFVADPLWAHEQAYIAGLLERFVRADFSDTSDNVLHKKFPYSDRVPFLLEESFGRDDGPVWLDLGSGVKIRIQGFIDRVDRIDDNQVVVIDYKTGSAPGIRELQDGRNFQMLIYLEGARALMQRRRVEKKVAGGVFWKLGGAEVVGALMPASDSKHDAYVQAAREQLADNIKQGRMGDFRTHPKKLENGRCIRYCEFSQLCRSRHGPIH
jgi:ATP-dependent helicase/DNAse subunit B